MWIAVSLLFALCGIFVPSSTIIESLRPLPTDALKREPLLLGASLFRLGLVALGITLLGIHQWIRNQPASAQNPQAKQLRYATPILLTLLLLSAGLRLYKLDQGLWLDEIGMYLKYIRLPLGEILTTYDSENQHFLYTILADLACSAFGDTAWSLRLPAVLFGLGSLAALYLLGCEISNARESILSVGLLSVSYYHIWFSQNARGYTGLLFWTLLSSWFLLRALRENRPRLWILYAGSVALGMHTQFTMIFVVVSQFLIYAFKMVREKGAHRWSGLTLGFLLSGLFTFQLYALVVPQFFNIIGMKGTVAEWNHPLWTLAELTHGMRVSFAGSIAAVAALIIFGVGFVSYLRMRSDLVALFLLPAVMGTAVVLAMKHPLWPRFYFFIFGFAVLIVVRGAMILGKRFTRSDVPGMILCIVMILVSATGILPAYRPKQDFVGARNFVQQNRRPGDVVVTVGRVSTPYKDFFNTDWPAMKSLDELDEVRLRSKRTWLVYMMPKDVEATHPEIMARIRSDFETVREFDGSLTDGTIYVSISPPDEVNEDASKQIQHDQ